MAVDVDKILKRMKAMAEEIGKGEAKSAARSEKLYTDIKNTRPPQITLTGVEKAYLEAIKSSGGLTSARPSTLKAVQAAQKSPSSETIKKACDELNKHVLDLQKASGSEKHFKTFKKNMDDMATRLMKQL